MKDTERAAQEAFLQIAEKRGISVAEVRLEIEKAIDEGMQSVDQNAKRLWEAIPRKGEKPTPEEFVL